VVMIAEKAADLVRQRTPPAPAALPGHATSVGESAWQ
jgi:hypothetical protein